MAFLNRTPSYALDKQVLKYSEGARFPVAANLYASNMGADVNGKKMLLAGSFVAEVMGANSTVIHRPLPATYLKTTATSGTTMLEVNHSSYFMPGDVLYLIDRYSSATVTGATAGTITCKGISISFTPTPSDATLAAGEWVTYLNKTRIGYLFKVFNVAGTVYFVGEDKITVSGGLTLVADQYLESTSIGTVSHTDEGKIYLTATGVPSGLTAPVLAGLAIGIRYISILGLYTSISLDLTTNLQEQIGLLTQGTVYKNALLYWNPNILTFLPNLDVD